MKIASIIGIIISLLGLSLTYFINCKIPEFIGKILKYSRQTEKMHLDVLDLLVEHFDYIQPNSYFLLYGFFIYFLVFSVVVYRKS